MPFNKVKALETQVAELVAKLDELPTSKPKVVIETKEDRHDIQTRGANAYLFKKITGKTLSDKVLDTRAINPADLPGWIAEQFKNDLVERMRKLANVEGMFVEYPVSENSGSLSIPQLNNGVTAYRIAPSQDAINSALQAEKVTFQTEALMTLVPVSDQAVQETVTPLLEIIKQKIAQALVDGMENVLINGDTAADDTNINGSAVGADGTSQLRLFDGLRKITEGRDATAPSKLDFEGSLSFAKFMGLKKLMGKESVKSSDLVFVVSPMTFHNLTTDIPEMVTVEKYGAAATVVTGEVAKIGAIPVVVSEFVPENLNSDGVNPGDGTGDKTIVLLINKTMFATASRGGATYENDRRIENRTNIFTGFRDVDFKELTSGLGIVSSALGYNIAV